MNKIRLGGVVITILGLSSCIAGRVTQADVNTGNGAPANTTTNTGPPTTGTPAPTTNPPVTSTANAGGNNTLPATGNLAIYWGQDFAKDEGPLVDACNNPTYSVVIISFVTSFPKGRNASGAPEMAIDDASCVPYDTDNPYLLKCDDIAAAIPVCQANGKKVILSFGGAAGTYGFSGDTDATAFAQTVWNMFLGGQSNLRPFGAAVLDGIDLDIEGGSAQGYATFAKALRQLMNQDTRKHYFITAAPQCPFPDAYLGAALQSDAAQAFDYLFVQFYNNYCGATAPSAFAQTLTQWAALQNNGGPRIFIGLPAATQAGQGYVAPADLPAALQSAKQVPGVVGAMLWDVSFDKQSAAQGGQAYSAAVVKAMLP